jgi:hypothetical protein
LRHVYLDPGPEFFRGRVATLHALGVWPATVTPCEAVAAGADVEDPGIPPSRGLDFPEVVDVGAAVAAEAGEAAERDVSQLPLSTSVALEVAAGTRDCPF